MTVPPSRSRPEAKTGSVLCRICGTARVDRESLDALLKCATGEEWTEQQPKYRAIQILEELEAWQLSSVCRAALISVLDCLLLKFHECSGINWGNWSKIVSLRPFYFSSFWLLLQISEYARTKEDGKHLQTRCSGGCFYKHLCD